MTWAFLSTVSSPWPTTSLLSVGRAAHTIRRRHLWFESIYDNPVTLKSRLRVIQRHWKRNHCVDHTRLILLLVELFDVEYYRDLEMWVRGHSRSFKMVPFESLGMVSYSPVIVTIAVSLPFWRYPASENDLILKSAFEVVQGHWIWRRSIDHIRIYIGRLLYESIGLFCSCRPTIFELFDVE